MQVQRDCSHISTIISNYVGKCEKKEKTTSLLESSQQRGISTKKIIHQFFLNYIENHKSYLTDHTFLLAKKILKTNGSPSCISPKNVLDYLFRNYPTTFLKSVLEKVDDGYPPFRSIPKRELTTSCYYTALACSLVFNGLSKTKEMASLLHQRTRFKTFFRTSTGKIIPLIFNNLFDSAYLARATKYPKFEELSYAKKIKPIHLNNDFGKSIFDKYYRENIFEALERQSTSNDTSDEAFSIALEKALKKIDFSLNLPVLNTLKKEINQNILRVSSSKSFAYVVAVTYLDDKDPTSNTLEHIFFIEQFLENEIVKYRLYESMINHDTFSEAQAKIGTLSKLTVDTILEYLKEGY